MVALHLLFTCLPVMNALFHSAPTGLLDWAEIAALSVPISIIVSVEKKFRSRIEKK
jgi:cation-transporting P-type ATPase F